MDVDRTNPGARTSFFITNIPNQSNNLQIQTILQSHYPGALVHTWKGKSKSTKLIGHLTVPSTLVAQCPELQEASKSNEGTPIFPSPFKNPIHNLIQKLTPKSKHHTEPPLHPSSQTRMHGKIRKLLVILT